MTEQTKRILLVVFAVLIPGASALLGSRLGIPGAVLSYYMVMLLPGAACYVSIEKAPGKLEFFLFSVLLSPVLTALLSALLILKGTSAKNALNVIVILTALFSTAAFLTYRRRMTSIISGRHLMAFFVLALAVMGIAGWLPLHSEWWRMHSDAWFHSAVAAQIDEFGIPPEDPYFAGFSLQYMWLYHVLILIVSKAACTSPFIVMPIVNMQALGAFTAATFLLSVHMHPRGRIFACGISSLLLAVFGLNALFWLLLPLKIARVFTGDVRGTAELANIFNLTPLSLWNVRQFLRVFYNQVFFLDKFIVSTAFSLGLALMAAFWYSACRFVSERRLSAAVCLAAASAGLLAFHSAVGFIMLFGISGGSALLFLKRKSLADYSLRSSIMLLVVVSAAAALMIPYLYSIMHLKEADNVIPFGLSFKKTSGIIVSCFLVIILAAPAFRRMAKSSKSVDWFFIYCTFSIALFCMVLVLPGPNTFDKMPFFVFFPLAVAGGSSLAGITERLRKRGGNFPAVLFLTLLLGPVNVIAMIGYCGTRTFRLVGDVEMKASEWVRGNTPRDAVFLDSGDRVFLLVTGPRRYYWGTDPYSRLWGYDRNEMAKRRHVRDNLFSQDHLDDVTIGALGSMNEDVYIIARDAEAARILDKTGGERILESAGMKKFARYTDLFQTVYSLQGITILRVDKTACLQRIESPSR